MVKNVGCEKLYSDNFFVELKCKLGLNGGRNIYWSKYEPHNFGDWITPYLFNKKTNKKSFFCPPNYSSRALTVFGAGSILRHLKTPDKAIVWGSGIISRDDVFAKPKEILCIRGPLTRTRCLALGFDCPEAYGDPGLLLPRFFQPKSIKQKYALGLIPHYINYKATKEAFSNRKDVVVIDVTQPIEQVIGEIVCCEFTAAGSLHGLIMSHSYGLKSLWVEFGEMLMGDGSKFLDYYQSHGNYNTLAPISLTSSLKTSEIIALTKATAKPNLEENIETLMRTIPF